MTAAQCFAAVADVGPVERPSLARKTWTITATPRSGLSGTNFKLSHSEAATHAGLPLLWRVGKKKRPQRRGELGPSQSPDPAALGAGRSFQKRPQRGCGLALGRQDSPKIVRSSPTM